MAHRHKHHAKGGGVKPKHDPDKREFVSSSTEDEAKSEKDHFKKGGHAKHAAGGKVVGRARGGRLDKRARGGGVGKSPFSSAHVKPHTPGGNPSPHKG